MWMQTVTASFALCMLLAAFSPQGSLEAAREGTRKEEKALRLNCFCVMLCHCLCCWCCLNRHWGKTQTDGMCFRESFLVPSWCLQPKKEGSFTPRLLHPMKGRGCKGLSCLTQAPSPMPRLQANGNMKNCTSSLAVPFPARSPASP